MPRRVPRPFFSSPAPLFLGEGGVHLYIDSVATHATLKRGESTDATLRVRADVQRRVPRLPETLSSLSRPRASFLSLRVPREPRGPAVRASTHTHTIRGPVFDLYAPLLFSSRFGSDALFSVSCDSARGVQDMVTREARMGEVKAVSACDHSGPRR